MAIDRMMAMSIWLSVETACWKVNQSGMTVTLVSGSWIALIMFTHCGLVQLGHSMIHTTFLASTNTEES